MVEWELCLLFYVAIPALAMALLFRGGLVLRAAGVAIVGSDGARASRLRVFWRSVVTWSPLLLGVLLVVPLVLLIGPFPSAVLWCVVHLGLTIWSLAPKQRGLQDRLAGTWLVPR